ncbi:hypothetical protein [Pseudanabaena sp. UWO310]|uniref:hypothetical protein n=1 Tax=Pseudanabaena sp. UWO310 TaxID=2480795 RepID=UPI00115C231A|nr:hypothetical protein [Pseudanabaena sp. UWO310]TYQ26406.1 hypothetical protein PseudUWO310_17410 [Pseudanabaena sp. UWO310]
MQTTQVTVNLSLPFEPLIQMMRSLELQEKKTERLVTAHCAQTQTKEIFESVALQRFQKFLCGSFD